MKLFHRAEIDDVCKPGFTWVRGIRDPKIDYEYKWVEGEHVDGEEDVMCAVVDKTPPVEVTWYGLRIIIHIPIPFKRMWYHPDFGRKERELRKMNWWINIELFRFGEMRVATGTMPR